MTALLLSLHSRRALNASVGYPGTIIGRLLCLTIALTLGWRGAGTPSGLLAAPPAASAAESSWPEPPLPEGDLACLDEELSEPTTDEKRKTGEQPEFESIASDEEKAERKTDDADGGDDVWLVDTRSVGCNCDPHKIRYWQRQACCWRTATQADFLAIQQTWMPCVFFIHGNSMTAEEARHAGWKVYQRICLGVREPFRFVIWSWPSNRMTVHTIRDVRLKAELSDQQGYFLGWLLAQMTPDPTTSLIGYSYGSRVVSSGLHLMSGGTIAGKSLSERAPDENIAARVLLVAAAQDFDGFTRCGDYRLALTQASELVVMRNQHDAVLRFYTGLEHPHGPPALGVTGLNPAAVVTNGPVEIRQVNVEPFVGARHGLQYYLESPEITTRLRGFVRGAYRVTHEAVPIAR